MRLILIRHGQAEKTAYDHNDAHRLLTAKGRERLETVYPSLARYLNAKTHFEVWTSPKVRALQTAEVLCRYTPNVAPEIKDFLAEGDLEAFYDAIRDHDHGETLVVIGNEPYLSEWVRTMTGLDVRFKKGRGEMLYLSPKAPQDAIRIHDIDFDQMANLSLFSMPLDISVGRIINKQHAQIIEARNQFLLDPDDTDALSALRVALRCQYAMLEFIQPYCKKSSFEKAEALYLSLYEDLEALRGINAILKIIHNSRKMELVALADALMIEHNSAVMELCEALSQPESEFAYNEALHLTVAALMTTVLRTPLDQLAREQFAHRYQVAQQALLTTDLSNQEETENLRTLCKTSRYLFEYFNPLANYQQAKQYLRIRRLNQRLSTYCDAYDLPQQLAAILGEDQSPAVERAVKRFNQIMADTRVRQLEQINQIIKDVQTDHQGA